MVISTKCYQLEIKGGICVGRFSCFGKTSETPELIQVSLDLWFKSSCVLSTWCGRCLTCVVQGERNGVWSVQVIHWPLPCYKKGAEKLLKVSSKRNLDLLCPSEPQTLTSSGIPTPWMRCRTAPSSGLTGRSAGSKERVSGWEMEEPKIDQCSLLWGEPHLFLVGAITRDGWACCQTSGHAGIRKGQSELHGS